MAILSVKITGGRGSNLLLYFAARHIVLQVPKKGSDHESDCPKCHLILARGQIYSLPISPGLLLRHIVKIYLVIADCSPSDL